MSELVTYSEVLYYKVQYMDQLRNRVALFHDDLPGPVREHLMPVLHPSGYSGSENSHGLPDDGTCLHGVSLQKTVENLYRTDTLTLSCSSQQKLDCSQIEVDYCGFTRE